MAAYIGTSRRIKDALINILNGITYDAGSGPEAAFAKVVDSNYGGYDGSPVVQVLPGREDMPRETVGQSDKKPNYIIRTKIALEDTAETQQAAFNQMYDLSDLIIDAVMKADNAGTLSDGRGPLPVNFMDAENGDWVEGEAGNGIVLIFDINVTVTYSKDLR